MRFLRSYSKCKDVDRMAKDRSLLLKKVESPNVEKSFHWAAILGNIEARLVILGVMHKEDLWIYKPW